MASRHKTTEREPVLGQTLSPSALAAPVGSLRITQPAGSACHCGGGHKQLS